MTYKWVFSFFLLLICLSCQSPSNNKIITKEEHQLEIENWVTERVRELKQEDGWLNLIGLYWLSSDSTLMGSGMDLPLVIEKATIPERLGYFYIQNFEVIFHPLTEGIYIGDDSLAAPIKMLANDPKETAKTLSYQSLRWSVIKRGEAIGVRIRDLEAETLIEFKDIPRFPTALEWRIEGIFTPYQPEKEVLITNVIGQTSVNLSPGFVSFEKNGTTYQIDALDAGNQLYLIVADASSGLESYGGGRYLYIDKPKQGTSEIVIDFNKAYNPPCVFTPYATCPLPPKQNILELYIDAGEKYSEK